MILVVRDCAAIPLVKFPQINLQSPVRFAFF